MIRDVGDLRRPVGLLLVCVLLACLSGCALWRPGLPDLSVDDGAQSTTVPAIDPLSVRGVRSFSLTGGGDSPMSLSLEYLDGDEQLNNALDTALLSHIDRYLGDRGPFAAALLPDGLQQAGLTDTAHGLWVKTDVILASQSWFGVRMQASKDGVAFAQSTMYANTISGTAYAPDALVGSGQTWGDGSDDGAIETLAFAPDGSAVLGTGTADDATSVTIPREQASSRLTDIGRAVQDAAASGAAFLPPATVAFSHVPCSLVACVAMTFDDGPSPDTTPGLLDVLADEGVHATFFVIGSHAAAHPEIVAREAADGDAVENHTWSHPNLGSLSADAITSEIGRADDAIRAAGAPTPTFVRAPFGSAGGAVPTSVDHPLAYWSVDSFDWRDLDPKKFVPRVREKVQPGGVVLMHDIYSTTVAGQRTLIDALRLRGYTFVTVPQLFSGYALQNGQQYTCRGTVRSDAGPDCVGR